MAQALAEEPGAGRWAKKSQSLAAIQAILQLARTEPEFVLRPDEVEPAAWRVPLGDGHLDVRTGELVTSGEAVAGSEETADLLDLGALAEDYRTELLLAARSAGFPALRVFDLYLEGEAAWRAFCLHPTSTGIRLAAVADALREAVAC